MKTTDALSRSDRVLVAALAIVLATASAAVGASLNARPHTDEVRVIKVDQPVVQVVQAPAIPEPISVRGASGDTVLASLLAEHKCLAEALYYETRGNTQDGQKAVAEVIFNRIRSGNYGSSICAVVYQGAKTGSCQFSWACNGALQAAREPVEWRQAQVMAARILTGEEHLGDLTQGAVGFHAVYVNPNWGPQYIRTVEIGGHVFYRRAGRTRLTGA
jgi:hypothetical protein